MPIQLDGAEVDLSRRVKHSEAVAGSPADATETIIATFTIADSLPIMAGIQLFGFAAFTSGLALAAIDCLSVAATGPIESRTVRRIRGRARIAEAIINPKNRNER